MNRVIQGDCLVELKNLEDNSVDSIVTDPPYELGFMGKSWDNTGIANNTLMWAECLRVLKPGGYLLSFGGNRTYHRMACAIEDAGFEVRDMIEWVYGSGFPKSLNIGKAVDKLQGNEREDLGIVKGAGAGMSDTLVAINKGLEPEYMATKGTSEWEGWGTALKPAHEPICMARKPLTEKTVAENVLKYGTGGINIDESRVGVGAKKWSEPKGGIWNESVDNGATLEDNPLGRFPANLILSDSEEVRECFPESTSGAKKANQENYNHDGKEFVATLGASVNEYQASSGNASRFFKSIIYQAKASKSERNKGCEGLETSEKFTAGNYSQSPTCKDCNLTLNGTNDHSECSGEVYYKEMESKNTKNNHPTVKPIALMEYLIKMVTPKGGIVLDPFAGSGTTLVAAKQNGFQYIGIEMTAEYIPIIEARLNN